jgi:hypothetical protein
MQVWQLSWDGSARVSLCQPHCAVFRSGVGQTTLVKGLPGDFTWTVPLPLQSQPGHARLAQC